MLIKVGPKEAGARLDSFVSEKTGITRAQVKRLLEGSLVTVNSGPAKTSYRVKEGDSIMATLPARDEESLVAEDLPVEILFSDGHVAVVDKPPGMVVYPAAGHRSGTLMNALRFRFGALSAVGGPLRPGVVHRLDRDTSGVMMVALSDSAYYGLVEQFRNRTVKRSYLALVWGSMGAEEGDINAVIGRSASHRKKMSTRTRRGREASTHWKAVKRFQSATLLSVTLATGRTHQIRVHLASVGHPVLGDSTYGRKTSLTEKGKKVSFPRQMLHAEVLGFTHPVTGQHMQFMSPLPQDMADAMDKLSALK
jgi:23S rRNA pseudouridine1911/1915/1917 synthase